MEFDLTEKFYTALKGIISRVLRSDEAPISEYRPEEEIECILTPTGVISRMTGDIYYALWRNKSFSRTWKTGKRNLE